MGLSPVPGSCPWIWGLQGAVTRRAASSRDGHPRRSEAPQITVVLNWFEELRERVPN